MTRDRVLLAAGVVFMLAWYSIVERLVAHGPFDLDLFHPALLGQAFNSMAEHLAAGRFGVDPAAIGGEAFIVDGRTIAYFGVFCALLRLPLLAVPGLAHLDITRLSCLIAICLGGWFQLRAVLLARDAVPAGPRRDWLTACLVVCILLGGQQIQFLRPTIYQEVVDWAQALAMGFVFLAARGVMTRRGFDAGTLTGMACFAGLALLTRVSFGLGLYVALGLVLLLRGRTPRPGGIAALLLLAFAAITGVVNDARWGNPLVFADFTKYAMNQDLTPDRLVRLAAYGAFNPQRIWLGLSYYILPIWGWVRPDGTLLFVASQTRLIDSMELPAGSFLVSDPLLVGLAAIGVARVAWPTKAAALFDNRARYTAIVILAGLAVPPALMLCAISMAFRYRMEFYPFLVFAALLGFRTLCLASFAPFSRMARTILLAVVALSICVSHGMAALYAVSPWGPAQQYIALDGWIGTYAPRLRAGHD